MTTLSDIQYHVIRYFNQPLTTASVGGSGTFSLDCPGGFGFPEALSCVDKRAVAIFTDVDTNFGPVPIVKVFPVKDAAGNLHPVIRIPMHGWRLPAATLTQTLATFTLLHQLGITQAIANASVGGLVGSPWDVAIPDDVDNSHNSQAKWAAAELANHLGRDPWVRIFQPFCPRLRTGLITAVKRLKTDGTEEPHHELGMVIDGGLYVNAPLGPFESAAEIRHFITMGGTVVGQSTGQEALAARVCGICFAAVNPIVNFAEGREQGAWSDETSMAQIYEDLGISMAVVEYWTLQSLVGQSRDCQCLAIATSTDLSSFIS
jgi:5'-methylthioadenosine phosphorylase